MTSITVPKVRDIVEDFASEIRLRKKVGPKPAKAVIDFRAERRDGIERDIVYVPIGLLRYRKDNGRISSDVLNYERHKGRLDECSAEAQCLIRGFLEEKDKEKTDDLLKSILHDHQREPAIITCDGFLINGNRRKMVMEMLLEQHPGDTRFSDMRVVILPGKGVPGGPPTLLEIEQIENRYQLQSDGKAEYSEFDRALSMRRKIEIGMSLIAQLRDDSVYAGLTEKGLVREAHRFEAEFLKPLECIDRYLDSLNRKELYGSVSRGLGDKEGRWQAFRDYYNFVYVKLQDAHQRVKLSVNEDEIGAIEHAAFTIIRKREIPDMPKAHQIMRDLPKWLTNPESKKALIKLADIDVEIPRDKMYDSTGVERDERTVDKVWGQLNATAITRSVKMAKNSFEHQEERETPIDLLEGALRKLNHDDMRPDAINASDIAKAMQLARQIKERAEHLEHKFYDYQKSQRKLEDRGKRK